MTNRAHLLFISGNGQGGGLVLMLDVQLIRRLITLRRAKRSLSRQKSDSG
jgi:hypothetical protein